MQFSEDGEPYLSLPPPLSNIHLTPPRASDGDAMISLLNDPRIYMNLARWPFPFMHQAWEAHFAEQSANTSESLSEWQELQSFFSVRKAILGSENLSELNKVEVVNVSKEGYIRSMRGRSEADVEKRRQFISGRIPVTAIRVAQEDGEDRFIGEIMVRGRSLRTVIEEEEWVRRGAEGSDSSKHPYDPRVAWGISFYLDPAFQGQGILTVALRAIMDLFLLPFVNIHWIRAAYLGNNIASRRVLEKNGFVLENTYPESIELLASKTGGEAKKVDLGLMYWKGG